MQKRATDSIVVSAPAVHHRHRSHERGSLRARTASGALLISALAHLALAVTAGTVWRSVARAPAERPEAVEIDVAPTTLVAAREAGPAPARPSSARASQPRAAPRLPRPRAAAGRAPTEARPSPIVAAGGAAVTGSSASAAPAEPSASPSPDGASPARFVLSAATVAVAASGAGARRPAGGVAGAATGGSSAGDAFPESGVSVPARLLASRPVIYPPAARQAEIEADLPLEIVVDRAGLVSSARGLDRAGYGLDESALQAIRSYRFSPALRDGRPVPVRMRWTVQFRLR